MEDIAGRLDVADSHGDIEVRYSKPPREEVNIQNETGEVEVKLPANSNFEIVATSGKGEAQSEFAAPSLNVASGEEAGAINGRSERAGRKFRLPRPTGRFICGKRRKHETSTGLEKHKSLRLKPQWVAEVMRLSPTPDSQIGRRMRVMHARPQHDDSAHQMRATITFENVEHADEIKFNRTMRAAETI